MTKSGTVIISQVAPAIMYEYKTVPKSDNWQGVMKALKELEGVDGWKSYSVLEDCVVFRRATAVIGGNLPKPFVVNGNLDTKFDVLNITRRSVVSEIASETGVDGDDEALLNFASAFVTDVDMQCISFLLADKAGDEKFDFWRELNKALKDTGIFARYEQFVKGQLDDTKQG